jgi:NADH-quinone oxidoreductase subunit N
MNLSLDWMMPLVPEEIVILCALAVLVLDFALLRRQSPAFRAKALGTTAGLGCVAAMLWIAGGQNYEAAGMLALTPLTQFLKLVLLALTLVVAVLSFGARFTRHLGEYFALLLIATAGMMLLISSENLLVIFLALEMLSLPLYVLTAFNKSSAASAEGALKYFLFGSVAAAFTLFGISLLYGLTGELQLGAIAEKLRTQPIEPVCYAALVMTLVGFAFKVAAAPLHFWAPDVYEGAPAPIACFIASSSKVASFFVLARIIVDGFGPLQGSAAWEGFRAGWMPLLAVVAVLSIVAGNLAALVQTSVKRLLAYSAIAHGGYALLAFFGNAQQMLPALFFYVITYALTVLGAFAVVSVVENSGGRDRLAGWAGLGRRAPLLSACMFVFMLSLAGVPPLSGFFGKVYLFMAALGGAPHLAMLWLVVIAVVASAVSFYYYLQVLKQIYNADPPAGAKPVCPPWAALFSIALLAALVIAFGCAPGWLLGKLTMVLNSAAF